MQKRLSILVIEDNPGDIRLIKEALKDSPIQASLTIMNDGLAATRYLEKLARSPSDNPPNIILLDLNLPKKNGLDVLQYIKGDSLLKRIPVIILSSSINPDDIVKAYDLHANCYLTKPVDFEPFSKVVRAVEYFWLQLVQLPHPS